MRAITKDVQTKILKEQFIPDHLFIYLAKGAIDLFDGDRSYAFQAGEYCLIRKNALLKFVLSGGVEGYEPVLFCFDEPFLRQFLEKHPTNQIAFETDDAVVALENSPMIEDFIQSLRPYYRGVMELDEAFEDLKYEELLIILLKKYPQLSGILFDFAQPEKISLEAFMNKNFKFNVSVERFAFLTGRSLSAFKRDFQAVFHETPGRWLLKKRLQEAYFLIDQKQQKPSEIYLELGFETLSHFSFAFKNRYQITPSELAGRK